MEGLYALLCPISASIDIWEATYLHVMGSVGSIAELMETTSLAPLLAPLDKATGANFSLVTPLRSRKPIRRSPTAACCCALDARSSWRRS
jgi:trans-aconitate methyltransferase